MRLDRKYTTPEGPARHLDASQQKLTPHFLAATFDSRLPSPKLSLKMPPKMPLPHKRGHIFLFQNFPRGEGNCAAIERPKLSRGNFCLAASRCLSGPSGPPFFLGCRPNTVSGSTVSNTELSELFGRYCILSGKKRQKTQRMRFEEA